MRARYVSRYFSPRIVSVIGVSTSPNYAVFTRTPYRAHSRAALMVAPRTPALAVVDLSDRSLAACVRGYVDDGARRFLSCLVARDQTGDRLHAQERTRQMDAQNLFPLRQRHLVDHGRPGNPGGIHHDPESRGALLGKRFYEFRFRDVPHGREDAIFGKLATSEPRNAQADALTGACDENRSPCERHGIAAVNFATFRLWLKMRGASCARQQRSSGP
jgi:hypothetical protein